MKEWFLPVVEELSVLDTFGGSSRGGEKEATDTSRRDPSGQHVPSDPIDPIIPNAS